MSETAFSAALCRGLIEARLRMRLPPLPRRGFPRLYAAASLKHDRHYAPPYQGMKCFPRLYAAASLKLRLALKLERQIRKFSAALCRGLIEASTPAPARRRRGRFSAALCRGLIEAHAAPRRARRRHPGFPRLYAAASLKRRARSSKCSQRGSFSAALCRGLIEASAPGCRSPARAPVFRGFMPRPH